MKKYDIIACVSWGNDSLAMLQLMLDFKLENIAAVYNNTGWSLPTWSVRIKKLSSWAIANGIDCFETESIGMEALVKKKKAWPRQGIQFCTQELKILPTQKWLTINDPKKESVVCVGIKRSDGPNRANTSEYVFNSPAHLNRVLWHPLYAHTEAERNDLILKAGFEVLPHRSKECEICINEKREDLQKANPDFVDKIERIETELGFTSNNKPRTMFRPYRYMGATGIREIIKWSKSQHGKFNIDDGSGFDCDGGMCGS